MHTSPLLKDKPKYKGLKGQFYNDYKIGKWEYFDGSGRKTDQKIFKKGKLNGLQ